MLDQIVTPIKTTFLNSFKGDTIEATWEKSRKVFLKYGLDPAQCTCLQCPDHPVCPYAFDVANYDGNCLGDR